ncbi:MAG: hypothetical protein HJJLKODD_01566 [Phycisphaerae bacterium]|nr:hypothetical protein [Phycisphaerae bacterium]
MNPSIIQIAQDGQDVWIQIYGPATFKQAPLLLDQLTELQSPSPLAIHIDLSECEWLDSTFAGCLVSCHSKQHPSNLYLSNISPRCRHSLEQMNLTKHLQLETRTQPATLHWQVHSTEAESTATIPELLVQAHEALAEADPHNQQYHQVAELFRTKTPPAGC